MGHAAGAKTTYVHNIFVFFAAFSFLPFEWRIHRRTDADGRTYRLRITTLLVNQTFYTHTHDPRASPAFAIKGRALRPPPRPSIISQRAAYSTPFSSLPLDPLPNRRRFLKPPPPDPRTWTATIHTTTTYYTILHYTYRRHHFSYHTIYFRYHVPIYYIRTATTILRTLYYTHIYYTILLRIKLVLRVQRAIDRSRQERTNVCTTI